MSFSISEVDDTYADTYTDVEKEQTTRIPPGYSSTDTMSSAPHTKPTNFWIFGASSFTTFCTVYCASNPKKPKDTPVEIQKDENATEDSIIVISTSGTETVSPPVRKPAATVDPFAELTCTQSQSELIKQLVRDMASCTQGYQLAKHSNTESTLQNVHTFKFLEIIFSDPASGKAVSSIQDKKVSAIGGFGIVNLWENFVSGVRDKMEMYKKTRKVDCYLDGFCKKLCLNKEIIQGHIKNNRWDPMIRYIIQEKCS